MGARVNRREQVAEWLRAHEASVGYRIRTLAQMIRDRRYNSRWRILAEDIVARSRGNPMAELSAIYEWTKAMIRKQRDLAGFEVFNPPERTMIEKVGDCDEHTSMIGVLAGSLGYPIKVRAVSWDGLKYSHVYPLADVAKGRGASRWVALDAVFGRGPGIEPVHQRELDARV